MSDIYTSQLAASDGNPTTANKKERARKHQQPGCWVFLCSHKHGVFSVQISPIFSFFFSFFLWCKTQHNARTSSINVFPLKSHYNISKISCLWKHHNRYYKQQWSPILYELSCLYSEDCTVKNKKIKWNCPHMFSLTSFKNCEDLIMV